MQGRRILSAIDLVNTWTGKIFRYLLLVLIGLVSYDVIARYFFKAPTTFGFELSAYLLLVMAGLAGGYALLHNEHVKVDLLWGRLPPKNRALLDLITSPLFFIFCAFLIRQGAEVAYDSFIHHKVSLLTSTPLWYTQMIVPLGAVLLALQGIAKFFRDIGTVVKAMPVDCQPPKKDPS